jgi:hypothetical protein
MLAAKTGKVPLVVHRRNRQNCPRKNRPKPSPAKTGLRKTNRRKLPRRKQALSAPKKQVSPGRWSDFEVKTGSKIRSKFAFPVR